MRAEHGGITDYLPRFRFVIRNGNKVLQQQVFYYNDPSGEKTYAEAIEKRWIDIPLEQE